MIDLKIKWQHCWYIFQWGENGKKGKIKHAGIHRGFPGDGMPIQNDNTVVQVPLSNLEVRIWASVTRHPLHFFYKKVVRTM